MMGSQDFLKPVFFAVLEKDYHGHAGKVRLERAVVKSKSGKFFASPVRSLGSGDMRSMTRANGIIIVQEHITYLRKGQKVLAQFI